MHSSKADLLKALDRINGLPMMVIGDVMLDRYVWGNADRISQEAPVPVVRVERIEDRLGGAGNVVRNLRALGATVTLCGFIGDDDEGKNVLRLVEGSGVNPESMIVDRSRPTTLKTRVIARNQQIVRIDREQPQGEPTAASGSMLREGFAAMVDANINRNRAVILSDYGKGAVSEPLIRKLEAARLAGRLLLKSRPFVVDPHPSNYPIYEGMGVAKPNRREAEIATGMKIHDRASAAAAAKLMLQRWNAEAIVLSLGESGLLISSVDGSEIFLDTVARHVFDVSGAGDTVSAVFAAAIASGASLAVAGDLANLSAGLVVSEPGTAPVDLERLRAEIELQALARK